MKKIILIILIAFQYFAFGQTTPNIVTERFQTNDSIEIAMMIQNMFNNLDANKISTGFLIDKALISDIDKYDGLQGNVISFRLWLNKYNDLYNSRVLKSKTEDFIKRDNLKTKYNNYKKHTNLTPIGIINIDYNKIKEQAVDSNLLLVQDYTLFDNPEVKPSPYNTNRAFLATPLKNNLKSFEHFIIDEQFFFTNSKDSIYSIDIDFGDGMGYRNVNIGDIVNVSYANIRHEEILLKVKFTYYDKVLECKSINTKYKAPKYDFNIEQWPLLTSTRAYNGDYASGMVSVIHGCGNNNKLRKPIIIVEGIDSGKGVNEYQEDPDFPDYGVQYGNFGIYNFVTGKDDLPSSGSEEKLHLKINLLPELLNILHADGYDIILLDFTNGTDYIQKNAFLAETLINRLNDSLAVNNSGSKITLFGISMGGLVTRYALSFMEQNGYDHNTGTWITFDSPHNGANVPLGNQFLLDFLTFYFPDYLAQIAAASEGLAFINSPASKQMLIYHYTYGIAPHSKRLELINDPYFIMPHKPFKHAISSGSGFGEGQGYEPGAQITNVLELSIGLRCYSRALPKENQGKTTIFSGEWFNPLFGYLIVKEKIKIEGTIALDNSPGGMKHFNAMIDEDWYARPSHSFIPTLSSIGKTFNSTEELNMDIKSTLIASNQYPYITDPSIDIPFDRIYLPDKNKDHCQIHKDEIDIDDTVIMNELLSVISPPILYLQNKTITDNYLFEAREKVIIGNNVTGSYPHGEFIAENTGAITVRAGQQIRFKSGTHIKPKPGGSFRAYIDDGFCPPFTKNAVVSVPDYHENEELHEPINYSQPKIAENKKPDFLLYPNPFSDYANVVFTLQNAANVSIYLINMHGEKIIQLYSAYIKEGQHTISFNGSSISEGFYFCVIETPTNRKVIKVVKI